MILTDKDIVSIEIDIRSTNILSTRFDPRTVYSVKMSPDVIVYQYDGDTYLFDQTEAGSSTHMLNKKGQEIYAKDFPADFRLEFLASASHPQDSYYMNYKSTQVEAKGLQVRIEPVKNSLDAEASSVRFEDVGRLEGHVWSVASDQIYWDVNWHIGERVEVRNDFIRNNKLLEISCIKTYCIHNIQLMDGSHRMVVTKD